MKRNDSLDANNVAADSSCNDAAKCTNGSILKGHCWFTDGYDSFDLTEDLYENEDGSFDLIRRAETPKDYFATFDCFDVLKNMDYDVVKK